MQVESESSLSDTSPHPAAFIDGCWLSTTDTFDIEDRFSGAFVARVGHAGGPEVASATAAAARYHAAPGLPPFARATLIDALCREIVADRQGLVATIIAETGFTTADAEGEFSRAIDTLKLSSEAARSLVGEVIPFAGWSSGAGRTGWTMRVPVGPVLAITPFNSPLNTVLHKVAPAIAAGNPVILKPSEKTPLTAARLIAATERAGFPPGLVGLLQGNGAVLVPLILSDPRIAYVAFTGSTAVGVAIQAQSGLRRTQMELGSIASTIIMADADLARAARLCASAAFRKAGQVCTSIQVLLVQDRIHAAFREAFVAAASDWPVGDPRAAGTVVGPMISEAAARKVDAMVEEALARGAAALLRGTRKGALLPPVILEGGAPEMRLRCEEAFGPVVCMVPFGTLDEAITIANATPYGLSAGVFTASIETAFRCAEAIDAGAVHINQTSSSRVDVMPYGGVKASGFGREGPHHAVREMTVERLVTFTAGD